jgi:hypothetical protein
MFFRSKTSNDAAKEAERQAAARMMAMVKENLGMMRDASPADAERLHQRVKDLCTDKSLPLSFKQKALQDARSLECNANMRVTDQLLREAMRMATGEQMKERASKLSEARTRFGKACALGADAEFRRAAQRLIETIMMSGGVHHPGPSRAKPMDFAPKAPNRAKT